MSQDQNQDQNQALVPVDLSQLPSTQVGTDAGFDDLSDGAEFLSRLQLCGKGKLIDKGLIAPGHWGIPGGDDEIEDLGREIDILPLARRAKALDMSDREAIITNYDIESEEFERIRATSAGKDTGCMYGVSFLVIERSTGRFLEYFCGSKSTRPEAKKIYPALPLTAQDIEARGMTGEEPHDPRPLTFRNKLVVKPTFSYHVPVISKCSTPFTRMPPMDKLVAEIERFLNPPADGVEKVQENEGGEERAR
jgi:hypothetical protein